MPELPEVETVRRDLKKKIIGRNIDSVQLHRATIRFPIPPVLAPAVTGRKVTGIERISKYLIIRLDDKSGILLHLGMSGRVLVYQPANDTKEYERKTHDHAQFFLDNGDCVIFNDPRRFGVIDYLPPRQKMHRLLDKIGIDPLSKKLTQEWLYAECQRRKVPMKTFLMNQEIVAGLGNIYVSEALYRAKIWPERLSNTITKVDAKRLVAGIQGTLKDAIRAGGSSLRDYVHPDGEAGYFQQKLRVYERDNETCRICYTKIQRLVQAGRSTYACPHCQK